MSKAIDDGVTALMDIEAVQGRTFDRPYQAVYYSGDTDQEYIYEFSGYTGAVLQLKKNYTVDNFVMEFSVADGSILLLEEGKFILFKNSDDMDKIRAGQYFYDMYLITDTGKKRSFLKGKFIIHPKISE